MTEKVDRLQKCREWLTTNKIFFETVAAVLLSGMAVIVSIMTYRISSYQADLLSAQNDLVRQQSLPHFFVAAHYLRSKQSGKVEDDQLIIENVGGVARGVEALQAVFFNLDCKSDKINMTIRVPVNGYYLSSFTREVDKVISFEGFKNDSKLGSLESNLMRQFNKGNKSIKISVDRYVLVKYQDIFGDKRSEYYHVENRGGAMRIPSNEGKNVFNIHDEGVSKGTYFDFDKVTEADMIRMCRLDS